MRRGRFHSFGTQPKTSRWTAVPLPWCSIVEIDLLSAGVEPTVGPPGSTCRSSFEGCGLGGQVCLSNVAGLFPMYVLKMENLVSELLSSCINDAARCRFRRGAQRFGTTHRTCVCLGGAVSC